MFVFFWHRTAPDQCFMFCNFTAPQKSELLTGSCTLVQTKKIKKNWVLSPFPGSGMDPGGGFKGARALLGSNFFFLVITLYFIFIVGSSSKNLGLFLLNKFRQSHPNRNYLTQKLNKNNKNIHNDDCIFAGKNYFTIKEPKNHVLLKKLKLNFLQLQ